LHFFFSFIPPHPTSPLFPYTTLFRSYGPELCLTGHTEALRSVCVSPDGKRLLTSSDDKTLRLWDAHTGKQLSVFEGHTDRAFDRSEEHTSELQSLRHLVCRLLLEKKK